MLQDLRYAFRGLVRSPGFAAVALLTLVLGIGANAAIVSVLNAVLLRPLPYRAPDQLAMLWTEVPSQGLREGRSSYLNAERWRSLSKSFADMAVFDPVSMTLTASDELTQISGVRISPNYFTLLGVEPYRGRIFSAEEAARRQRVVVISHRFWQTRFNGAVEAIGATIEIDGALSEVVGILPEELGGDADVWEPHTLFPDWEVRRGEGGDQSWFVVGRLREDVSVEQAQSEMTALARRLDAERGASGPERGISIMPLSLHIFGPRTRLALWMLTGAVFCVFLIGVTNITGLSLARSAGRTRELALRSALGASSQRLFRQLLTESMALAVLSGLIGLGVAATFIPAIMAFSPGQMGSPAEVRLDARVIAWTLAISVLAGVLIGLVPAMAMRRQDVRPALSDGGRGSSVGASTRLIRRVLVVAEFALAIVLLVGAGLMTRSFLFVERVDPGFDPDRVLSIQLSSPVSWPDARRADYYHRVLERVESLEGVESSGIIGDLFIGGTGEQLISVEGSSRPTSERVRFRRDEVSDRLFETLQIPLIRGRSFTSEDGPNSPRVAIVNETMSRRLWPGDDPIGRRFTLGPPDSDAPWFTVVGLVGDIRRQGLENEPVAQMFEPLVQNPSRNETVLVRTAADDPLTLAGTLQAAIRGVEKSAPVYGVAALSTRLGSFQAERRFQTALLGAFSLVALFLAAIGIYGMIHYSVATRTHEIGVRMAVGADRGDIFRMIVGEGLKLSLTGLALGLVGAVLSGHVVSSLLSGVTATDPLTYLSVSLLLIAVAAAGCYIPAVRASRLNPLAALRYE